MSISRMAFCVLVLVLAGAVADAAAVPSERTITVSGLGTAKAAPDEASFSAGVVAQGATAAGALAANSRAMNGVFATLRKLGIPDKDIQTSNLSLSPQYQSCRPGTTCPQRIIGYEASNTVTVTVELGRAGAVLDALVSSGSNQIGGISFDIRDPKPLLAQARADAVKDAMARAETYAKAAGVALGPILSIQEGGSAPPRPIYRAMNTLAGAPPPVAGGEQTLSATVTITWLLQ